MEDLKRPDIVFHLPSKVLATDISVTHPSAKSYVKVAARPLGAAAARERDKVREYGEKARQEGMAFLPFVMETYGAFGKHALEILSDLDDDISYNGSRLTFVKGHYRYA